MTCSVALVALSLTGLVVGVGRSDGAEPNHVVNGGFEQRSPLSPPPGWTMWGTQKYKIPANNTRDTRQPHSGEACFRIHHPAGTEGYIVSSPESTIRPKPGKMYTLTFWARADYVNRNANVFGMMHLAVRLIHYLREGMLRGASSWEMFTYRRAPGFGFLAQDAPQLRSMTYWLYYHFNRHAGRWVLAIDGTSPYCEGSVGGRNYRGPLTPVVATLSDDEKRAFVVLANGSWNRALPCRIELKNFAVRRAEAVVLSHSDPDGYPLLERKEDLVGGLPVSVEGPRLAFTLPPHAVALITVQQ